MAEQENGSSPLAGAVVAGGRAADDDGQGLSGWASPMAVRAATSSSTTMPWRRSNYQAAPLARSCPAAWVRSSGSISSKFFSIRRWRRVTACRGWIGEPRTRRRCGRAAGGPRRQAPGWREESIRFVACLPSGSRNCLRRDELLITARRPAYARQERLLALLPDRIHIA